MEGQHRVRYLVFTLFLSASAFGAPPADSEARRHFDRGLELYGAEQYAEAVAEFEAAKAARPSPALDFNIARCLDRLGQYREAVAAYEHYLSGAAGAADEAEVRAKVEVLRARLTAFDSRTPAAVASPSPTPLPALTPARPRRVATWVVGGLGAAMLVGSLGSGLAARSRFDDLSARCAPDGTCDPTVVPGAQALADGGRDMARTSDALLGLGVVAVSAGVILYFTEPRLRRAPRIPGIEVTRW